MEAVEFLGIVFRSAEHASWFKFTMVTLALSVILSGILVIKRVYLGPAIVWGNLGSSSLMISLIAVFETKFGTVDGRVWSADCIWYNALLGGIYLSVAAFSFWIAKKRGQRATR